MSTILVLDPLTQGLHVSAVPSRFLLGIWSYWRGSLGLSSFGGRTSERWLLGAFQVAVKDRILLALKYNCRHPSGVIVADQQLLYPINPASGCSAADLCGSDC